MSVAPVDPRDPIFHDEDAARTHLEALRWPNGPPPLLPALRRDRKHQPATGQISWPEPDSKAAPEAATGRSAAPAACWNPTFMALAEELAEQSETRKASLQAEILELEAQTAQKKAALHAANLALDRLANFQVEIGGDCRCSRCWIDNETRSCALGALPRPSASD